MILSRPSILEEIDSKNLKFTPDISIHQVGASSVDLRLGTDFIYLDKELAEEEKVGADVRWFVQEHPWRPFEEKYGRREQIAEDDAIELFPKKMVLGFTMEYIQLPPYLAGRIEGKSGQARRGLMIHLTAPTIQAGFAGNLQLELYNVGPTSLLLMPGRPICQLVLEQVTKPEQYEGEFQEQTPT